MKVFFLIGVVKPNKSLGKRMMYRHILPTKHHIISYLVKFCVSSLVDSAWYLEHQTRIHMAGWNFGTQALWQNQSELYRLKYVSPFLRAPTCFKRYNLLACRVTSR
jgi:hypothetical protein